MRENKGIYTPAPESKEKQERNISNTMKYVNKFIGKASPTKDIYLIDAYLYAMHLEATKDNKFCDVDPIMVQYAIEDLYHTEILSDDYWESETEDAKHFDANPRIEWLFFSSDHSRVYQRRIYKFPNNYGADVVEHENTVDPDFRWRLDIIVWDGDQYYPCADSYIPDTCHCMLNVHKVNTLLGLIKRLPRYDG